jgi:hypothetical protein
MRVAKMRLARLVVVVVSATMFLPSTCVAWTSTTRGASSIHHSKTTRLFNVPPPSAAGDDPVALKTYANREKPPASFYELQINCARAAKLAMADGHLLLEIEVRHSLSTYVYTTLQHFHSCHDTLFITCVCV